MADDVDLVTSKAEFEQRIALYGSHRDEPNAVATGKCLFCDEPVETGRRWCNAQCCKDWELENQ